MTLESEDARRRRVAECADEYRRTWKEWRRLDKSKTSHAQDRVDAQVELGAAERALLAAARGE
jgi:hypothetical protein